MLPFLYKPVKTGFLSGEPQATERTRQILISAIHIPEMSADARFGDHQRKFGIVTTQVPETELGLFSYVFTISSKNCSKLVLGKPAEALQRSLV